MTCKRRPIFQKSDSCWVSNLLKSHRQRLFDSKCSTCRNELKVLRMIFRLWYHGEIIPGHLYAPPSSSRNEKLQDTAHSITVLHLPFGQAGCQVRNFIIIFCSSWQATATDANPSFECMKWEWNLTNRIILVFTQCPGRGEICNTVVAKNWKSTMWDNEKTVSKSEPARTISLFAGPQTPTRPSGQSSLTPSIINWKCMEWRTGVPCSSLMRYVVIRDVGVKKWSLHYVCFLASLTCEWARGTKRRILHPDSLSWNCWK